MFQDDRCVCLVAYGQWFAFCDGNGLWCTVVESEVVESNPVVGSRNEQQVDTDDKVAILGQFSLECVPIVSVLECLACELWCLDRVVAVAAYVVAVWESASADG